jgi:hypothetical protein
MRPLKPVPLPAEARLAQIIPVPQAAAIKNVSVDTFKRRYPHLIREVSERRRGVRLGDLISDAPKPA